MYVTEEMFTKKVPKKKQCWVTNLFTFRKGVHTEAGHTLYTFVTAPVATVALLDAEVADGLSLLTYLGLRTEDVASGIMTAVSLGWNINALFRR